MSGKPSMDQLKASLESSESEDDDSSNVDEEITNAPAMNIRPEASVGFDEIVDFGFAGDVTSEQNIAGDTDGRGGSVAITVRNPTVIGGHLYRSTDPTQSAEYKLVGDYRCEPDYNSDGDVRGIKYGVGTTFNGELVESFDDELVTVYLSGGMGTYIARSLDVHDGSLVEWPPEDSDLKPAIRSRPVLRKDMEGRGGAIMARLPEDADPTSDERYGFFGTVFGETDGDYEELTPIRDTEHEGFDADTVEDRFTADSHWETSDGPSESATTENSTKDLDLSLDDETSYDDLSEEWQAFVDQIAAQDVSVDQLDVGDLAGGFAEDNGLDMDVSEDTLEDIIRDEE